MAEEQPKVGMLLDPDNFYGESQGRMGPLIKFLVIAGAPALVYAYFFLGKLPLWLIIPVYIIYVTRVAMITLGREKERVAQYKKQLNDEFASTYDLVQIKTLHPDGCCEYTGNKVAYFIVSTNKTSYDDIVWSQEVARFLSLLTSEFEVDIYVQNITDVKALDERYDGVKLFADQSVAKDFIDIIDHNRSQVYSTSLLTKTIYVVRGFRSDWEKIKKCCNNAVHSTTARIFKNVHIANDIEVNDILSRDINGLINLPELMQNKYCTHQYYGSKVLAYDDDDKVAEEKKQEVAATTGRGFMASLQGRNTR